MDELVSSQTDRRANSTFFTDDTMHFFSPKHLKSIRLFIYQFTRTIENNDILNIDLIKQREALSGSCWSLVFGTIHSFLVVFSFSFFLCASHFSMPLDESTWGTEHYSSHYYHGLKQSAMCSSGNGCLNPFFIVFFNVILKH